MAKQIADDERWRERKRAEYARHVTVLAMTVCLHGLKRERSVNDVQKKKTPRVFDGFPDHHDPTT